MSEKGSTCSRDHPNTPALLKTKKYPDIIQTHRRPEHGQPRKERGRKSGHRWLPKGLKSAQGGVSEWTLRSNQRGETDLTRTDRAPETREGITGKHAGRIPPNKTFQIKKSEHKTQSQRTQRSAVIPVPGGSRGSPRGRKRFFMCLISLENQEKI